MIVVLRFILIILVIAENDIIGYERFSLEIKKKLILDNN